MTEEKRSSELFKNTIIFAIGNFGSRVVLFLLVPLYTITMSTEEYGMADLINSSVTLVYPILTMGFTETIMRYVIGQPENRSSVLKFGGIICCIGTIVMAVLSFILGGISAFGGYEYLLPILFVSTTSCRMLEQYCKGLEKNKYYSLNGIISAVTKALLSFCMLAVFDMGVLGYIVAICVSEWLSILFLLFSCKVKKSYFKEKIDRKLSKEMLSYGLPMMPEEVSWQIILMSDRYMINFFCGAALNGIYTIAYKIPAIFNMIVTIFMQSFAITAFKMCDEERQNEKFDASYFGNIYKYYIAISFVAASLILLLTKPLTFVFVKKEFFYAWVYTPLLICAFSIGNLQSFYGRIYQGLKKTREMFITTFLGAILNIILNIILIHKYEAFGAAIATLMSYLLIYLLRLVKIKKYIIMDHSEKRCFLSIILIVIMSVLYIFDNTINYILCCLITLIIVYVYKIELKVCMHKIYNMLNKLIKRSAKV